MTITNLFLIIGKPGAEKYKFIHNILSDVMFIDDYKLKRFVHGTTRKMRPYDTNGITYYFYTKNEYDNIDPKEIIESRSYDDINTEEISYYFTLKSHIKLGNNYVGTCSVFQYMEIRKWANIFQLDMPTHQINIYPIYIQAPLRERLIRMINRNRNDDGLYTACAKILTARYEYSAVLENRVIDKFDPRTCFVEFENDNYDEVLNTISKFIKDKIDDGL